MANSKRSSKRSVNRCHDLRKHLKPSNLTRLLAAGEADIAAGKTRPIRAFLREFKNAHKVLS